MKGLSTCLAMILALTGPFVSCKKNKDKKADCRIVTITDAGSGSSTLYNITYNNDGKISTLTSSPGSSTTTKVFTYTGNTVNINTTFGSNGSSSRDSIMLDSRGRLTNIRSFGSTLPTEWTNISFEYNGDDLLKFITTSSSSTTIETSTTTYANGNMVALQAPSNTITLEYYTDKKVQPGDYLEVVGLIQYGITIYPHKNLVKSISSGSTITNFNYEFDADGKITKVIGTSGSTVSTLTYQYQCK